MGTLAGRRNRVVVIIVVVVVVATDAFWRLTSKAKRWLALNVALLRRLAA